MSVESLQLLSAAAYVASAVMFLTAVLLFFVFKIPKLFGDISGITARKSIESIKLKSKGTDGGNLKKTGKINLERKMHEAMTPSGNLRSQSAFKNSDAAQDDRATTDLVIPEVETTILKTPVRTSDILTDAEESPYSEVETTILKAPVHTSDILTDAEESPHTDRLSDNCDADAHLRESRIGFNVIEEFSYTSSSEIIE